MEDLGNLHWNEKVDASNFQIGRSCTTEEVNKFHCRTIPAQHPVIMGQFNGKRVCGKRGGSAFIDADRVQRNGTCPEGTSPCVLSKSLENRICYPEKDHATSCPITDLTIVSEVEVDQYRGRGYSIVEYSRMNSGKTYLAFSKLVDSLPLTSFRMENKPCLDSW